MPEKLWPTPVRADELTTSEGAHSELSIVGGGEEKESVTMPDSHSPKISFADMDGDGDLDIVVHPDNTMQSYWLENTLGKAAESVFEQDIFKMMVPTAFASGDIDGDGTSDVVLGHASGAKVFHNDGAWAMKSISFSFSSPRAIILEDIDRDGQTDILIRDSHGVTLLPNHDGQFGACALSWPVLGNEALLAVGDFDLTNAASEILTLDKAGTLGVISQSAGQWQALRPLSSLSVSSFQVVDFNNDGLEDIYVQDHHGRHLWFENSGAGSLSLHQCGNPSDIPETAPAESSADIVDSVFSFGESTDSGFLNLDVSPDLAPPAPEGWPDNPSSDASSASLQHQTSAPLKMMFFSLPPTALANGHGFDFHLPPEIDLHYDPELTVDYSGSDHSVLIDMEYGDVCEGHDFTLFGRPLFSGLVGTVFKMWTPVGELDHPDEMIGAIGSESGDQLFGNACDNILDGGDGCDFLYGQAGDDTLLGGEAIDLLLGGEGDDQLFGGNAADILIGEGGDDLIYGGDGDDNLTGDDQSGLFENGNDTLIGGDGDDVIMAGRGDDVICGGMGADSMYGQAGNDTFHYVSAQEGGDSVFQFESGVDSFEFEFGSHVLYTVEDSYNGDLGLQGDAFIWNPSGDAHGILYYDADTSASGGEIMIAEVFLDIHGDGITVDDISIV